MKKDFADALENKLQAVPARSAWARGVKEYAADLLEGLRCSLVLGEACASWPVMEAACLNGAANWAAFSWGGCSLIYDADIAGRLCNHSELIRTAGGRKRPNRLEEWLDVQARALFQAARLLHSLVEEA